MNIEFCFIKSFSRNNRDSNDQQQSLKEFNQKCEKFKSNNELVFFLLKNFEVYHQSKKSLYVEQQIAQYIILYFLNLKIKISMLTFNIFQS